MRPARLQVLLLLGALLLVGLMPQPPKPASPVAPAEAEFDIAVLGGTPEGVAAAVAAARMGRRVLLVEPRQRLGGLLVHAGLNSVDLNRAPEGGLLNGGIFAEWYGRVEGDSFDTNTAASVFFDMVSREQRITLWLGTALGSPLVQDGAVRALQAADPTAATGERMVTAARFIDATEDAEFAAAAGVAFTVGRQDYAGHTEAQAATLVFRLHGVNWQRAVRFLAEDGDPHSGATARSLWGFNEVMYNYQPDHPRIGVRGLNVGLQNDGSVLINALWIFGVDPLSRESREEARSIAISELPRVVDYIRAHCPGFERAELAGTADDLYVRESRHMSEALYTLSIDDVLENRDQPDAIGYGSYPVDIQAARPGERVQILGAPKQYAIPLRSLVPRSLSNLAVASRAAGYTSLAHGSARTVPVGMAAGQAAGVAAAVSLAHGVTLPELATDPRLVGLVQLELRAQNVHLAPFHHPSPLAGHPFAEEIRHLRRLGLLAGGYDNEYPRDGQFYRTALAHLSPNGSRVAGRAGIR